MIVLSASNITKAYGTDVIIQGVDFHVNHGDRIGLVGRNGAGKTTLLNILTGQLSADEGSLYIPGSLKMGYLKQRDNFAADNTVIEEINGIFEPLAKLEEEIDKVAVYVADHPEEIKAVHKLDELQQEYERKGGYTYKSEMTGILSSMAFGEEFYHKKISSLSGGERTRLALAALLLEKPDLLILDEPTNHLDIGTLKWLEQYLAGYKGSIIIVSHDRYFLDRSVNRIFEIENHKLRVYEGNYTSFAEKKRQIRQSELRAYNNQQKEIARQEEMIRHMKERGTEKLAKRAQSREKRLENMEKLHRPEGDEGKMKIQFNQDFQSGNDVILTENLSKSFGYGSDKRQLFQEVDMDIKRGEKICIVGNNGVGKTTLLKILLDEIQPETGRVKIGHNVTFGYYDQGQQLLNNSNTVLEEMKETYRLYTDTQMRSLLGRFLFKNDDVFLNVGSLSGGEKARLALLKLMLGGANTLLLDEPTNHMDIESKEVFEEALAEFPGTAIIISHDRYFLQKIPNRILELTEDGIIEYLGKYDYYMDKKSRIQSGKQYLDSMALKGSDRKQNSEGPALSAEERRRQNKAAEAEERRKARKKAALEKELEEMEEEIKKLEEEMCCENNSADYELLAELGEKLQEVKCRYEAVTEEWILLEE